MKNKKLIKLIILAIIVLIIGIVLVIREKSKDNKYSFVESEKYKQLTEENLENEKIKDQDDLINENEELDRSEEIVEEIEYINMDPEEVEIPILMYHSICGDYPDNGLMIAPEDFSNHMQWLSENGFTTMSLEEAYESFKTGKVPKKPVVITFDDGYADNYLEAFPVLKKYNMKATFFIITNNTDKDGYYMSSDMLREMQDSGMEIENHTAYHFELGGAALSDQQMTIEDGKEYLKETLGIESKYLCYPAGKYDDTTIELEEQLGVKAAVTTEYGFASINDGLYTLKRIRISPMSIENFASIFSSFTE